MTATETATLNATARVRQMIDLTERLTGRLADEAAAFETRRPQDVAATVGQTQDLANAYRRESARIKAAPSELAPASIGDRQRLIAVTQTFEAILARHALAVEAARIISEGLVKTIAAEVTDQRGSPSAYGASGRANAADGRAVAYNAQA